MYPCWKAWYRKNNYEWDFKRLGKKKNLSIQATLQNWRLLIIFCLFSLLFRLNCASLLIAAVWCILMHCMATSGTLCFCLQLLPLCTKVHNEHFILISVLGTSWRVKFSEEKKNSEIIEVVSYRNYSQKMRPIVKCKD